MNFELIDGMAILWFVLITLSLAFVLSDIRKTPEVISLKWGFVILTLLTGPFGLFMYIISCREPLPNTHEQYINTMWRQAVGSTMHCVVGDGIGIIAGAVIAGYFMLDTTSDLILEYFLGFGFGWSIFQALAMKNMLGSYSAALKKTFYPEFVSMNMLVAVMFPWLMIVQKYIPEADEPTSIRFWFIVSFAVIWGFAAAYPLNWWLVKRHLKHGMFTIRAEGNESQHDDSSSSHSQSNHEGSSDGKHGGEENESEKDTVSQGVKLSIAIATILLMAAGITVGFTY